MTFSSSEDGKSDPSKKMEESSKSAEKDKLEETPASPDPSVSPDFGCQILPIIIPTERSTDFIKDKINMEQGSLKIPVITITERTRSINISSSDSNHSDDVVFTEWDMLEESQKHNTKTKGSDWQQLTASGHDVASAAKLVSNNLPQKVNNDSRGYSMGSRTDIPTVPVPSLGGSRRLSSVLEKTKILNMDISIVNIRPESPVNVPEVQLKSPDPEIMFSRSKVLSPRSKDSHDSPRTPTKTPMPLLVSPPPISTEPPLSMEDLEELLGNNDEKKGEKKGEDSAKHKKDFRQETNLTKNNKVSKELSLSYLAAEKESEKQWQEVDKHIVKLSSRKCTSNVINATSAMITKIDNKSNEIKGPPDHRLPQSPSTSSKFEPRYADNYERHPRQRDPHSHENAKEKPNASENICRMPDQEVSLIPMLHNPASAKVDERIGVPLYQRRPNGPKEGWKDIAPSRSDNEFVIEGTDYYNMHMNQESRLSMNPLHWPIPSVTTGDPFGKAQWAPSTYSGIANPPIPPYQHPMGMFMGGSPVDHTAAGPRPLNLPGRPQDVSHATRPENIRDEIPSLMSTNIFPPQYRGFQMGQGSYDPNFDRPAEYSHARSPWEGSTSRGLGESSYNSDNMIPCGIGIVETSTGVPYSRSDTPCPWTRDRNRGSRGRGRESYYNERNRAEIRPNFSRDVRRSDWPRDSHSDRENSNRFNRDNRNAFERDPRVRMEHNATISSQAKETSSNSNASARDPRLAKDKHFSPTKVKDATHNERDPRKRLQSSVTSPVTLSGISKRTINKEKLKPQKLPEKRVDSESSCKEKTDVSKLSKADRMQSPLESLYGAIDTKSSHSGGLQKFKIPKIKRPESSQPSSTTSHVDETKEAGGVASKSSRFKSDGKKSSGTAVNSTSLSENLDKDDAMAEVSSTSGITDSSDSSLFSRQADIMREDEIISSLVEETNKRKSSTTLDVKSIEIMKKNRKDELEADGTKSKDEVTQEWIEALIRKSFECGEGKKLVEHAKLLQKLGEALQAKKLKKIQKIIESESESSNSDKDETIGPKKSLTRKKRRVIVSDSSDDESLAERLNILNTSVKTDNRTESVSVTSIDTPDSTKDSTKDKVVTTSDRLSEEPTESTGRKNDSSLKNLSETSTVQTNDCSKIRESETNDSQLENNNKKNNIRTKDYNNDNNQNNNLQDSLGKESNRLEDNNENINICPENDKQLDSQSEDGKKDEAKDQPVNVNSVSSEKIQDMEESLDKSETDKTEPVVGKDVDVSSDKPKTKTKRRNSLEMLQEDIREMFISDEVVTATGFRMCRLSKENQLSSGSTATSSKKDETFNASVRESSVEADESTANNVKSKKTLSKSRNSGESKSKSKSKKDVTQQSTRKLRSKESIPNSDSEEDQPLALRTEWKQGNNSNNTLRQEEDEEFSDMLRKSKRMLHKEPRVLVEKTDISKLDLSKMMFDSSSDESFSIDVSELTAAVDISLRPDKQSDQDSVETIVNSKPPQKPARSTRSSMPKKSVSLLADCKSDDGMSFTDESVISDISMSSSTTASKKSITRAAVKEELLSNILVGLVPTTTEKSITDKDNEADVEEDLSCPSLVEMSAKKSSVKKKKKKSSWRLGILSKKKKKKNTSATTSKASQIEREDTSNEIDISMDNVKNSTTVSSDNSVTMAETISKETTGKQLADDVSADSSLKCDNVVQQSANTGNSDVTTGHHMESSDLTSMSKHSNATEEIVSCESIHLLMEKKLTLRSTKKINTKEAKTKETGTEEAEIKEASTEKAGTEEADTQSAETECVVAEPSTGDQATKDVTKVAPSTIVYDEAMEELFRNMNQRLIQYAWTGQDRYKCQLCFFTGKNIVYHYKIIHPDKEVLIARFRPVDAEAAILDAKESTKDEASSSSTTTNKMCKYRCRFCWFETEGAADIAIEAFYEHCTTHTGEYRYHCKRCTYKAVAKASMKTHYYKMCRKINDTFNEAMTEDNIPQENGIYGYLCRECNYVQLKRKNVETHAKFWHRDKTDTKILKINMSMLTSKAARDVQKSQECKEAAKEPFAEEIKEEVKPQVSGIKDAMPKDTPMDTEIDTTLRVMDIIDVTEPQNKSDDNGDKSCDLQESQANDEMKQDVSPRMSVQGESEGPVNTGNMSVFVCPPELENKEVEIQLERKKRMQEIVDNIGIKINKNLSKSSLSIIDKLQNKMRTDTVASPVNEHIESANVSQQGNNEEPLSNDSSMDSSKHETDKIINESPLSQSTTDSQVEDPSLAEQSVDNDESETANSNSVDKVDVKIRDPLVIMDPSKNPESDGEISDAETVQRSPVYDSDSSSEQSDSETTDVNMILKETSSINASLSRDPMLTTIQRLAAQLQSAKPLEVSAAKDVDVKNEPVLPTSTTFPKAPSVISIASAKTSQLNEDVKDRGMTPLISNIDDCAPKNFLRFRRLSGDMLSLPVSLSDNQEDTQASSIGKCVKRDNDSRHLLFIYFSVNG